MGVKNIILDLGDLVLQAPLQATSTQQEHGEYKRMGKMMGNDLEFGFKI